VLGAELDLAALTDARLLRSIQLPNHKLKVVAALTKLNVNHKRRMFAEEYPASEPQS
jgi:hypothetical protein